MTLAKLCYRLAFLKSPRLEDKTEALAIGVSSAVAPLTESGLIPQGTADAISEELLYGLMRHRSWLGCQLLIPVLIDHVASYFGLPEQIASACVCGAHSAAKQILPMSKHSEADFLKYICVSTAISKNEIELEIDLGLGKNLINRIKQALGLIAENHTSVRYLAELDQQITAAVSALADDLARSPCALERARLHYLLLDAEAPWDQVIDEMGSEWIFDFLSSLVEKHSMTLKEISVLLDHTIPTEFARRNNLSAPEFCRLLTERGLIAADGPRKWRNLPLASQITAPAVAPALYPSLVNGQRHLSRYDRDIQIAVVTSQELSCDDLLALVRQEPALNPVALRTALHRIAADLGPAQAAQLLRVLAARELPSFAQAVVSEMLLSISGNHGQESLSVADSEYENRSGQFNRPVAKPWAST